jgi:hypothetical protein
VLDRFMAHGFREGLTPTRPVVGPMHSLTRVLLDAFGEAGAAVSATVTAGSSPHQ